MASDQIAVRRIRFSEYETEVTEILEEYQRWVAEQYQRRLSHQSGQEETDTTTIGTKFSPETYVFEELDKDVEYLKSADGERPLVAAFDGNDIVGCVYLYQLTAERGEVKRLYVRDTYRGFGLGRRLMQTLIDFATETGFSTLQLSTTPVMQDAQELYQQLGFTETDGHTSVSDIPIDEITYMELLLE